MGSEAVPKKCARAGCPNFVTDYLETRDSLCWDCRVKAVSGHD